MKRQVEKYINSELLTAEKSELESTIVREGFDFLERRAAWSGILADTFDNTDNDVVVDNRPKFWRYALGAGIALVLALALGVWAMNQQSPKKTERKPYIQQGNQGNKSQLIADVATQADVLLGEDITNFHPSAIRKGSNDDAEWKTDFQAAQYPKVIAALEKLGQKRKDEQAYYLAQAYLRIDPKNTVKAQPLFQAVANGNNQYALDALWSYALICLINKENGAAKIALERVVKESPAHRQAAETLLKNAF